MTYLSIEDISVSLSGVSILEGINLKVEKGDFIGIIGPNGSGKSTLLKSLYRTIKPKHGTIYLDGTSINDMSYKQSAQSMAVVGQHNDHSFEFTVFELVMMGRAPHKKFMEADNQRDISIAEDALNKVSMMRYRDRDYSTLSGGEKQRVILARALAQETPLLILDEPTNHLDIKHQLELMNVVKALETTTIFAVHDLNIALMYCNKLCILEEGKIVSVGKPEELITSEMIRQIYGVSAEIIKHENQLHVIYKP